MKLMEQNARTKLGAWSVERNKQGEFLVIYVSKVDATASPAALKSIMEYVAKLTSLAKKDLAPSEKTASPSDTLASWLTN